MKNGKAFLFNSKLGMPFVVVFVTDIADDKEKLLGRAFGYEAFPNRDFTPMHSINQTTSWLKRQGNVYIKRLPLIENAAYTPECEEQIWKWLKESPKMLKAG